MNKVKQIFGAHPIAWSILLIVICAVAITGIYFAPTARLQAADIPERTHADVAIGEAIPVEGEVVLAQKAGRTLTLDTKNVILTLTDDATGMVWTSGDAKSANGMDKALLVLSYLGDDNNLLQWNTYDNSVAFGTYKLFRIADGVRVELNVNEGESQVFYEYLPQRMPIERYENWMLPAIEKAVETGALTRENADKYARTLGMVYKKNISEGCYIVAYAGNPPVSAVAQMIDLVKSVGYDRELLIEDCAVFGTTPTFHEAAEFELVAEFSLDDAGDLIARVPTAQSKSFNDFYRVQRIAVMPSFGSVSTSQEMDGYVLTPDGAGALMRFNTYDATIPEYVRPFYENDYFQDYYFTPEFGEELLMPVYGMLYGGDEAPVGGLLAIVEQGAETANLHVALASGTGSGSTVNRAYVSVDALDYAKVKIYGPYSDKAATYLSSTGLIDLDFTVRYRPFAQAVTYYDLAVTYRDYLAQKHGKTVQASEGAGVYLEAVGALTLTERMLGVPYNAIYSMTSYAELTDMLAKLPQGKLTVQYDGAYNGGVVSELNDGARLVKQNGTAAELAALKKAASSRDTTLLAQVNLSRVYEPGRTFLPYSHALRNFSNESTTVYNYTPTMGIFNGKWDPSRFYYLLSPRYLPYVAEKFVKECSDFDAVAVGDLAHDFYADYRYRDVIDPLQAAALVQQSLDTLSAKPLALTNPQADYAPMGKYAVDISRESSGYASFYATVPFRQLVLSGLTQMTTKDVNLNSRSLSYYLLQAAELGTDVKFTVTGKRADVLKNSHFEYLYAVWFQDWQSTIAEAMTRCEELRQVVGGQLISGHRLLASGVTETTYENGVRIICNYTNKTFTSQDGEVPTMSYLICPEGGAL